MRPPRSSLRQTVPQTSLVESPSHHDIPRCTMKDHWDVDSGWALSFPIALYLDALPTMLDIDTRTFLITGIYTASGAVVASKEALWLCNFPGLLASSGSPSFSSPE